MKNVIFISPNFPQNYWLFCRALRDKGVSILFSTHITSDLDKCADAITYIRKGQILASRPMGAFLEECRAAGVGKDLEEIMLHYEKEDFHAKLA